MLPQGGGEGNTLPSRRNCQGKSVSSNGSNLMRPFLHSPSSPVIKPFSILKRIEPHATAQPGDLHGLPPPFSILKRIEPLATSYIRKIHNSFSTISVY